MHYILAWFKPRATIKYLFQGGNSKDGIDKYFWHIRVAQDAVFGLRNAGWMNQRMMDQIPRDIPHCFVYVDVVLIASADAEFLPQIPIF